MTPRSQMPAELQNCVFSVRQALDAGVTRSRLRARDITGLAAGLYAHGVDEPTELARAAALRYWRPELWLSHASAARAHGLWIPPSIARDPRLHVSLPRLQRTVRAAGFAGHAMIARADDVLRFDGVAHAPAGLAAAVSSPVRTWLDLAPLLSLEELIVLGDQLVRRPYPRLDGRSEPWATLSGLDARLNDHRGMSGTGMARRALDLIRVGSDSPPETRMRLAIMRAGLPEPELQVRLDERDPHWIAADMGYRGSRLALHYEGAHHRTPEQFERDIRRDEAFSARGWRNLRFTREDWRQGFGRAVIQLRGLLGVL